MTNFTGTDLVAIIVIIGCFVLLGLGVDSFVQSIAIAVIGYYFGRRKSAENKIKEANKTLPPAGQ